MEEKKKKRVMIVDDSVTILKSAALFLKGKDYELSLVDNGFKALGEIYDKRPDLIFIDVMMPTLDGFKACLIIKQNEEFSKIPIIFLSGKNGIFDKAKGKLVGADEYLSKPFTKDSLMNTIERFI